MSFVYFIFNPLPEVQFWHQMYVLIADDLANVLKMLGTELEPILFPSHFRIYVFGLSTVVGVDKLCIQKLCSLLRDWCITKFADDGHLGFTDDKD
jgi:hypothetical protein